MLDWLQTVQTAVALITLVGLGAISWRFRYAPLILLPLLIALALYLVSARLLLLAIAGCLGGFIAAIGFSSTGSKLLRQRRQELVLFVCGLLMLVTLAVLPSSMAVVYASAHAPAVTVRYEGMAEHQRDRWTITEQIVFDTRALEAIQQLLAASNARSIQRMTATQRRTALRQELAHYGWSDAATINGQSNFRRLRQAPAPAPRLSGSFTSELPIINSLVKSKVFRLIPNADSHLRIIAPVGLVGATSPPSDRRPITEQREQFEVSLDPPESEQREVQVQLLSPFLRSEQGQAITKLTAAGWFGLLLTLIAALLVFAVARAKQHFLEPIVDQALLRLRRRRTHKKPVST